jgi:hypothetical protein
LFIFTTSIASELLAELKANQLYVITCLFAFNNELQSQFVIFQVLVGLVLSDISIISRASLTFDAIYAIFPLRLIHLAQSSNAQLSQLFTSHTIDTFWKEES